MSSVAAAVIGAAVVGAVAAKSSANKAAKAAKSAAGTEAQAQMEALEYTKEREAIPTAYREQALQQLGLLAGFQPQDRFDPNTGEKIAPSSGLLDRDQFMQGLQADPFYQQQVAAGEQGVLRGASATGGLRSGNASAALAEVNQQALRAAYLERIQGLQGLSGLPSNTGLIAGQMAGIGETQAQGILGVAQANQAGRQGVYNSITSGLGMGLKYGAF